MMQLIHISGYKFISLTELNKLHANLLASCQQLNLKGTILLSTEGINLNLSGTVHSTDEFCIMLKSDERFDDIPLKITSAQSQPYRKAKVRIKKEIITLRHNEINPLDGRASSISPKTLKAWLDENRNILLLDARNDYEIEYGTFTKSIHLNLKNFCEFPAAIGTLPRDKEIVMFCTGGIRCEKAAIYLSQHGFNKVHQLEGGILNYFAMMGDSHYKGNCYVFDDRMALNSSLEEAACKL